MVCFPEMDLYHDYIGNKFDLASEANHEQSSDMVDDHEIIWLSSFEISPESDHQSATLSNDTLLY